MRKILVGFALQTVLFLCVVVVAAPFAGRPSFDVRNFGAKGDGVALDTAAIQRAIDACEGTGGRVVLPRGTYVSGSIYLKRRTELHIEKGAVLKGSPNLADYNEDDAYPQNYGSKSEGWSAKHLVLALETDGVSITGEGAIDGNAGVFMMAPHEGMEMGQIAWRHGYLFVRNPERQARPGQELVFIECRDVRIEGVTLRNMAMWTCFFHGCEDVSIRNVTIRNDLRHANTDGFDIDCCRNVAVVGCDIETGDDAFAIRGCPSRLKDKTRICENILVSNCVSATSASGIRIGVGDGTVRNVTVSDFRMKEAGRALLVQTKYPGTRYVGLNVRDVVFRNIEIEDCPMPIMVVAGSDDARARMENVTFENVRARTYGNVVVAGSAGVRPRGIRFKNVAIDVGVSPVRMKPDWESGKLRTDPKAVVRIESADNVNLEGLVVTGLDQAGRIRLTVRDAEVTEL